MEAGSQKMVAWKQEKWGIYLRKNIQTTDEFIRGSFTLALKNVAKEPRLFHAPPSEVT